jgi:hypothetical protein
LLFVLFVCFVASNTSNNNNNSVTSSHPTPIKPKETSNITTNSNTTKTSVDKITINRNELTEGVKVGSGAFGDVFKVLFCYGFILFVYLFTFI